MRALSAEAREARAPVSRIARHHAEHLGRRAVRRRPRQGVVVLGGVPRGDREEHALLARIGDHVAEGPDRLGRAPARVDHPRAHLDGVPDGFHSALERARAPLVEEPKGHELDLRVRARDAALVVARPDDPGHVRSVHHVVVRVVVALERLARAHLHGPVPAVDIVDVAVGVVVDLVAGLVLATVRPGRLFLGRRSPGTFLAAVAPEVFFQILVLEVDPRVDDRHDHARRCSERLRPGCPRLRALDVRALDRRELLFAKLAAVVAKCPLLAEELVLRQVRRGVFHHFGIIQNYPVRAERIQPDHDVGTRVLDRLGCIQPSKSFIYRHSGNEDLPVGRRHLERIHFRRAQLVEHRHVRAHRRSVVALELHDEFAGNRLGLPFRGARRGRTPHERGRRRERQPRHRQEPLSADFSARPPPARTGYTHLTSHGHPLPLFPFENCSISACGVPRRPRPAAADPPPQSAHERS